MDLVLLNVFDQAREVEFQNNFDRLGSVAMPDSQAEFEIIFGPEGGIL
jgi:hypothetical protein